MSENLRVNIIDTVFFTVTCVERALCLFWHVLPFSATFFACATCCCILCEYCPWIMSGKPNLFCIDKLYLDLAEHLLKYRFEEGFEPRCDGKEFII
jgi:hypothetical protein